MSFVVPAPAGKLPENRFVFEIDGTEHSVPRMEYLTGRQARALAGVTTDNLDLAAMSAAWSIFDDVDDATGEAVRGLEVAQLTALLEAWVEASQVAPGESERSSS